MNSTLERLNATLERLHAIAPLPCEVLTIEQAAPVLGVKDGSFRNMLSQGRLPFQVRRVGGSVKISKEVLAKYLVEEENKEPIQKRQEQEEKPTRPVGRPKNSIGFQRHAAGLLLAEIERLERAHRADLESVLAGKTYPPDDFIQI